MQTAALILTSQDIEDIVSRAVERSLKQALPGAIRKGTRKKWLTTDEVMEMLQCSRRHVQHLRDSKALSFTQHGRSIRYDVDDVENFLNNHKIGAKE